MWEKHFYFYKNIRKLRFCKKELTFSVSRILIESPHCIRIFLKNLNPLQLLFFQLFLSRIRAYIQTFTHTHTLTHTQTYFQNINYFLQSSYSNSVICCCCSCYCSYSAPLFQDQAMSAAPVSEVKPSSTWSPYLSFSVVCVH